MPLAGDHAPEEILLGCAQAMEELGVEILLSGDQKRLESAAAKLNLSEQLAHMEILHCSEVLTMEDEPASVVKEKAGSSMAVGLKALAEGKEMPSPALETAGALVGGGHHHRQTDPRCKKSVLCSDSAKI